MHLPRRGAAETEAARRRLALVATSIGEPETSPEAVAEVETDPEPSSAPSPAPGRHAARGLSAWSRVQARLCDALPPTVRGRWGITSQHVTVLAVAAATALALGSWWLVQARPAPVDVVPLTAPSVAGSPSAAEDVVATASAPSPSAGPDRSATDAGLVVHVAGKVRDPGIVALPAGARVIDALQEAGGPRRGVDMSSLNLARPVADGEQIVVGAPAAVGAAPLPPAAPDASTVAVVDLNTATAEQLEELPGVGPVTAASILDWRAEHGRFSSVEELLEVSGIGEATLADLRDHVTV